MHLSPSDQGMETAIRLTTVLYHFNCILHLEFFFSFNFAIIKA